MVEVLGQERRNFPALTGIRFFAAVQVLLFHYGAAASERAHFPRAASRFMHNGYLGVSLFFVLSGYILAHNYGDSKFTLGKTASFLYNRLARLYPIYFAAMLLGLFAPHISINLAQLFRVFTLTQCWTSPFDPIRYNWVMQSWTLSVELGFYLLFPFIVLIAGKDLPWLYNVSAVLMSLLIVTFGLTSVTPASPPISHLPLGIALPLPLMRLPEFLLGFSMYRIQQTYPKIAARVSGSALIAFNVFGILLLLSLADDSCSKSVCSVLFAALCVQLANSQNKAVSALGSPPFLLLGGSSYGLYLFQGPIHAIISLHLKHPLDQVAAPIATLLLSIVMFTYYEEPSRRWLARQYRRLYI